MKALSLNQPFADLIVTGKKTIELRRWKTKFRGEFLVHASKKVLYDECERLRQQSILDFEKNTKPEFVTGAIIGKAFLYDVKEYELASVEWTNDKDKHLADISFMQSTNGFLISDPIKFDNPIPYKGQLNFFEVDENKIGVIRL